MTYYFKDVLVQLGRVTPETFRSDAYRRAVAKDIAILARVAGEEDQFFNAHAVPQTFLSVGLDLASIKAWKAVLESIKLVASDRFSTMHKGTPYYFMGTAAYRMDDFERALFWMDSAVSEDVAANGENWVNVPAGYFFRLDADSPNQYARDLVLRTRTVLGSLLDRISTMRTRLLELTPLVQKLVQPAISGTVELRSAVTALFTYALEYEKLLSQLRLSSSHPTTLEPVYLNLFKGTLLLETLLKRSRAGQTIGGRGTLKTYLQDAGIKAALGLPKIFKGMGEVAFEDVVNSLPAVANVLLPEDAFRIAWGVRNTAGHSLSWGPKPSAEQYELLFLLIFTAVAITVEALY